jgi:hypothetical protein
MANTLATPSWTLKEVLRGYNNEIKFVSNLNRTYDDQYEQAGAKVGYTVNARLPQRFTVTDGQAFQPQALYDQTVPISLTNQKNVGFGYSTASQTMELDAVKSRYVQPAAEALANASDVLAYAQVYRDIYSAVGTPGTTPATNLLYLQAGVKLTDLAAPQNGRKAVLDPLAMVTLVNANLASFNPSSKISGGFNNGRFASDVLAIDDWYTDPNKAIHTTGTFTSSTPTVNGAGQTGSSLITQSWASGATTLKKGDIFTLAGVNSVNPLSYTSTGRLQQFVLTADAADSGGAITFSISPSIITSGQLQTVDASPASGAAITVLGATSPSSGTLATTTSPQSIVFHPDFAAFVMADLAEPGAGAQSKAVRSKQFGVSIRWVQQYQIGTDQNPSRLDILIGAATLQPRLACRIFG